MDFFSYDTLTELTVGVPDRLVAPDLTTCFRYADLIDSAKFVAEFGVPLPGPPLDTETVAFVESQLTVEQVFRFTPDIVGLFDKCLYKTAGRHTKNYLKGSACGQVFEVYKFVLQNYMCYSFNLKNMQASFYTFKRIASGTNDAGTFYSLELTLEQFNDVARLKPILHSPNLPPYRSAAVAPLSTRFKDQSTGEMSVNQVDLTYSMLSVTSLPPPYGTMCKHYRQHGYLSANNCMNKCLENRTLAELHKMPFSTIIKEPIDQKQVSTLDLQNLTLNKVYIGLENACHRTCSSPDCFYDLTLTKAAFEAYDSSLRFDVQVPREPLFEIVFRARIRLTELVVNLSSCFGLWFSFSVLGFNPFPVLLRKVQDRPATESSHEQGPRRRQNIRSKSGQQVKQFCVLMRSNLQKEIREHNRTLAAMMFGSKPMVATRHRARLAAVTDYSATLEPANRTRQVPRTYDLNR
ncbi:hypothetical protein HDE_01163 [Halotydeus destructor]|nr:hypothetical protein HDE_01163 [Halotydeus destructor]